MGFRVFVEEGVGFRAQGSAQELQIGSLDPEL